MKLGKIFKRLSLAIAGLFIVASTVSVSACSSNESFTLTLVNENEDGGTLFGEGTYKAGSNVTISYNANTGYKFASWDIDGNKIKVSNKTYTFKMPKKDIVVKGGFELKQFKLRFDVYGYGGVSVCYRNGEPFDNQRGEYIKYYFGEEITFTVEITNPSYVIEYWKFNEQKIAGSVNSVTIKVPAKDSTLYAEINRADSV